MSTNYYWHTGELYNVEHCKTCCCREQWVLHIGHFAAGSWSFQGHFDTEAHGYQLTSRAEWKAALLSGGTVECENGKPITAEELIADIESVSMQDRRRQYDWLCAQFGGYRKTLDRVEPGGDWLDADGFTFHGGEFS